MRMSVFAAGVAVLIATAANAGAGEVDGSAPAADFDFYVLALSWSPGFCDAGGAGKAYDQCAAGAASGIVVHGLWPESLNRPYPANCGRGPYISGAALKLTHDVYPAEGLAIYEYRKHGTCTGLAPEAYFGAVKSARDHFTIPTPLLEPRVAQTLPPRELENALIKANPGLTSQNFALTCENGELTDIRICLSKTLYGYVDCPRIAAHSCHARAITIAPLR